MDDYTDTLQEIANELGKLESNLVAEINELRASTELVLKELTLYLNVSANDITTLKDQSFDVRNTVEHISKYMEKLDFIENKIIALPAELQKLSSTIKDSQVESEKTQQKFYNSSSNNLKKVYSLLNTRIEELNKEVKNQRASIVQVGNQMTTVVEALKSYKEELNRGETNLIGVINSLIKNKGDTEAAGLKLQETQVSSQADVTKAKIQLWMKIVGAVLGSGGLLWLIFELVTKTS